MQLSVCIVNYYQNNNKFSNVKLFKFSSQSTMCILLWMFVSTVTIASNSYDNYPQATVSSQSKLNIRSGPGKEFDVIGQLMPSEGVRVVDIDNAHDGWIGIYTQKGVKGYVSQSFLSGNYLAEFGNMNKNVESVNKYDNILLQWYHSFYLYLRGLGIGLSLAFLLLLYGIEVSLIILLKRIYGLYSNKSPLIAYIVLIIAATLTLPGIFIYKTDISHDTWSIIIYLLMLLSTGCLMLYAAWKIKLCGMDQGKWRNSKTWCYQTGRWIGNILWLLMLVPFAKIWLEYCNDNWPYVVVKNSFGSMLLTIGIMAVINFIISGLVWPFCIVRYLFHTANQGIVYIMSFILVWGIVFYEYRIIYRGFYGLNFFFALILFVLLGLFTIGFAWNTITSRRCKNCHSFNTGETGSTELGNIQRISSSWQDVDPSSVKRRYDSVVGDAKRQVETIKNVRRWRTNHTCFNCSNDWDMDHEETVGESSRTRRTEWKEYY